MDVVGVRQGWYVGRLGGVLQCDHRRVDIRRGQLTERAHGRVDVPGRCMARCVHCFEALRRFEALPFKGRVWVGMGFPTAEPWLDNAPADRKPIPTPALTLKGRGKDRKSTRLNSSH